MDLKEKMEPEEKRSRLEPKKLRKFKKIPIFVVDYHNDVLEFLFRCFGSRHIAVSNNTLIHFDSHPDMVISNNIPANCIENKDYLLTQLSIENWIMPTLYSEQFNHLVWLKNSWCTQIPVGKYNLKIGEHQDIIYVDLEVDYFGSEGNYSEEEYLESTKEVKFEVYNVDDGVEPLEIDSYVLDIDLDYFSTKNPFLDIYKEANCYDELRTIFKYNKGQMSLVASKQRRKDLEDLRMAFEYIDDHKTLEGFEDTYISKETHAELQALLDNIKKHYKVEEVDWLMVYDAGCTSDTDGLPHHVSSDEELKTYYKRFKDFIQNLHCPPVVVTISRSSEDDYCPVSQVNEIQKRVVEILIEVFGEKIYPHPIMHYLNEKWDVMDL